MRRVVGVLMIFAFWTIVFGLMAWKTSVLTTLLIFGGAIGLTGLFVVGLAWAMDSDFRDLWR